MNRAIFIAAVVWTLATFVRPFLSIVFGVIFEEYAIVTVFRANSGDLGVWLVGILIISVAALIYRRFGGGVDS